MYNVKGYQNHEVLKLY